MSFPLEEAYQEFVRFAYTSLDRVVLRGYVPLLQGPGGLVTWARQFIPGQAVTNSWLASLARRFQKGVQRFAAEHRIPLVPAPKGERKDEVARKHRDRLRGKKGVYLIIRGREKARLYESREARQTTDPLHRNLVQRERYIDHYYFYIIDEYWGPMSVKFCSHLPFNVTVFLNGNRWLAREAERKGLRIRAKENSVVRCSDPATLQDVSDSLTWQRIRSVCDTWAYRLLPAFTEDERRGGGFRYRWFFSQVEMSHNLVFRDPRRLTEVLEEHVDRNRRSLHPYSLKTVFSGRASGLRKSHCDVSIRHSSGGLTVLKAGYGKSHVRQYNNHGTTFRTEGVTNDPRDLGVGKSIENLDELRRRMLGLVSDFQAAQAPALATTLHRGELTALAEPGKIDGIPTAGIKLENERILAVIAALPRLASIPEGFRTSDLCPVVEETLGTPYTTARATYDLRKLRGKGIVARCPGRRVYRTTSEGFRIAAVLAKLRDDLLDPVLGTARRPKEPPDNFPGRLLDTVYETLGAHLRFLCELIGLKVAA